jgi:phospholipase C
MATGTGIEHVVIIVKENHTLDNYFGTFPGATGVKLAHAANPPPPTLLTITRTG